MKKMLLVTLLLFALQQAVLCMDILKEIQNNRPDLYQTPIILEYSSVGQGVGSGFVSVQKILPYSYTLSYVEFVKFTDLGFWQDKNLNDLNGYLLSTGVQFTLFGSSGLLPLIGMKTYNFKFMSVQAGLTWLVKNDEYKTINNFSLVYEGFLQKVSFLCSVSI